MKRRYLAATLIASLTALAADPTLLVLLKGASALGFYSQEGKLLTSVPVGQHPHEMVISPDGRYLYTTDNGTMKIEQAGTGGNTVSVIDLAARKKVGEIDLGKYRRPHGIDLDQKTGKLYVTTELPDQLLAIDTKTRKVLRTYDTKGKTSHMVTLDADGKVAYVSNSSSAGISAVNLDTGEVKVIPTGERPEGTVLSKDGARLYIAHREGHTVGVIDTASNKVISRVPVSRGPVRIDLTPDGKTLVWAAMHDKVVEFLDTGSLKVLGKVPLESTLVSLHVSDDGKLAFASGEYDDKVYVISVADRKLLRTFTTAKGSGPDPVMMIER